MGMASNNIARKAEACEHANVNADIFLYHHKNVNLLFY